VGCDMVSSWRLDLRAEAMRATPPAAAERMSEALLKIYQSMTKF
jgi:hypothetical protein